MRLSAVFHQLHSIEPVPLDVDNVLRKRSYGQKKLRNVLTLPGILPNSLGINYPSKGLRSPIGKIFG